MIHIRPIRAEQTDEAIQLIREVWMEHFAGLAVTDFDRSFMDEPHAFNDMVDIHAS